MNYRDKAKQLHENVNHTYDGYNYVLHLDAVEAVHQEFKDELDFNIEFTSNVSEAGKYTIIDKKITAACYLHDTIEDTRTTFNDLLKLTLIDEDICNIVYALTNEKGRNREERANDNNMKKKTIKIPIYGGVLKIKIVKNWKKLNKKFNCNYTNSVDGCAYYTIDKDGVTNFHIEFLGKPSLGVIVHESVHCVNHIFRSRGVKLNVKKDEHQAYFTEWIFEQVSNYIEEFINKLEK